MVGSSARNCLFDIDVCKVLQPILIEWAPQPRYPGRAHRRQRSKHGQQGRKHGGLHDEGLCWAWGQGAHEGAHKQQQPHHRQQRGRHGRPPQAQRTQHRRGPRRLQPVARARQRTDCRQVQRGQVQRRDAAQYAVLWRKSGLN